MQPAPPPSTLAVEYFDGRSARATPVTLRLMGDLLLVDGEGVARREPVGTVQWPERTRHGTRVAHLADGASLHCADALAWDRWMRAGGHRESAVVAAQQSWRGVFAALVLLVVALFAIYEWGVPAASRGVVALMPRSVDAAIGEQALASIDEHLMKPSTLPDGQQQRLRTAFARAVATLPAGEKPDYKLLFRASEIGPNAFALPGGSIILTDELVTLVDGDEQVITGVLNGVVDSPYHSTVVASFNEPDGSLNLGAGSQTITLSFPKGDQLLVPSQSNGGVTTAQAVVASTGNEAPPVPEPSMIALALTALGGLALRRRLSSRRAPQAA